MAPKGASGATRRGQKHSGKNGKKEGLSGSSFFTWFMVIALLGVWTSVAVVWFDLVDYEEFLGKLGDYDADGDGDFDVDDAKVLLGLKERSVSEKVTEDRDETDSIPSEISDADLEDAVNAIKDSLSPDNDVFDIEDALDDHETNHEDDAVSEFSLEDAVEPNVHQSLSSEPEVKDEEEEEQAIEEPVIEEQVIVEEEPAVELETFEEVIDQVLEQELAAAASDDDVQEEEAPVEQEDEQEPEPEYEQEVVETETEFLNAPETENEESEDVEYAAEPLTEDIPAPVADEEPEVELTPEEQDPQDEVPENQEEYEAHEESVSIEEENLNEPSEDETVSYDEVNEYNPQTEVEEEEPAELSDVPEQDEETVPEQTEESAPETPETTDDETVEAGEDVVVDDGEEEVNDVPLTNDPSEAAEAQDEEPETSHGHTEIEQNEIPENPVVDDRPSEKVEEQYTEALEGQQEEHADT